jgi:hypothetical protein
MKNKVYILAIFMLLAALFAAPAMAEDSEQNRERQIKAAFLYNFINVVDWPKEKMPDNDEPIIIGVIGNKDFIKAFDPIKDKQIRGKKIIIKHFKDLNELKESEGKNNSEQKKTIESLKKCHVVLFCTRDSTPIDNSRQITDALKNSPVLTVGEQASFLENGGTINFLMVDHKIRFEINLDSAKRNSLKIRSKLLKLAKRVIKEDKSKDTKS